MPVRLWRARRIMAVQCTRSQRCWMTGRSRVEARLQIRRDDNTKTLIARVLHLEHQLYPAVPRRFTGGEIAIGSALVDAH